MHVSKMLPMNDPRLVISNSTKMKEGLKIYDEINKDAPEIAPVTWKI